jgi:hypothetical protein
MVLPCHAIVGDFGIGGVDVNVSIDWRFDDFGLGTPWCTTSAQPVLVGS